MRVECRGGGCNVERHTPAEEEGRIEPSQHDIGVSDGWAFATIAIAGRSWICPGARGPTLG